MKGKRDLTTKSTKHTKEEREKPVEYPFTSMAFFASFSFFVPFVCFVVKNIPYRRLLRLTAIA